MHNNFIEVINTLTVLLQNAHRFGYSIHYTVDRYNETVFRVVLHQTSVYENNDNEQVIIINYDNYFPRRLEIWSNQINSFDTNGEYNDIEVKLDDNLLEYLYGLLAAYKYALV